MAQTMALHLRGPVMSSHTTAYKCILIFLNSWQMRQLVRHRDSILSQARVLKDLHDVIKVNFSPFPNGWPAAGTDVS